jgi:glutamate dehydrogenase
MRADEGRERSPEAVLEDLAEDLRQRFGDAGPILVFGRLLFARAGAAYAEELGEEERVALVASAFGFFEHRTAPVRCRVWTPTFAADGWDSAYTIVETHLTDRPFIVDTIRECLKQQGAVIRHLLHPLLAVERDAEGRLLRIGPAASAAQRESFVHCAIERIPEADHRRLARLLEERLQDVCLVTDDYRAMVDRVEAVSRELEALRPRVPEERRSEIDEAREFLDWLRRGGFVFLGARSYTLTREGGRLALEVDRGSGLGLLRKEERSTYARRRFLDEIPPGAAERITGGPLLLITRTTAESPVHRRARMDYIGVKRLDAAGAVAGEHRFLGLFTSKAYAEESAKMPILREKLRRILAEEQVIEGSHDYKEIVAIFNSMPKTELLTLSVEELRADIRKIQSIQRTEDVHVSLRPDDLGRGLAVMVIVPKERFSAEMRREVQQLLERRVGGTVIDYQLALGEGDQARLHFFLATPDAVPAVRAADLEAEIAERVRSWDDRLRERLRALFRGPRSRELAERYTALFTSEYKAATAIPAAVNDIRHLEELFRTGRPQIDLSNPVGSEDERSTLLKIYLRGESLVLSDFLPVLENFGLRVFAEDAVRLERDGEPIFLHRFRVQTQAGERLDVRSVAPRLAPALLEIRDGRAESDPLNRLIVEAGLSWREVDVLRTYRNLAFQLRSAPSREALTEVLVRHPDAARALFDLFAARFDPALSGRDDAVRAARERFAASLERVETSGEDRMLRNFLALVEATLRTNYYRPLRASPPYLSLKLHSQAIPFLPKPRPLFEVYVHSARMEGVHLRGGKVARGGIRYSDRHDDFRTEILGLMKTQMVKNAVIVPVGSKGGFIVKTPRPGTDGGREVEEAYATLIRGLLDLTDNYSGSGIVAPEGVVRYDDDDPYLVVAADKGTATFSDLANAIAREYGFWLGDAFASGGSHGYDHKKEGITARGAWECVKRHFREAGKDIEAQGVTVVGIGDMSGDVFGNGMLQSRKILLRAAFDHRHVFLDPNPDPERSYRERERLFRLPRSSWDDYDRGAMSPGAMVVARTAKAVRLTPEVREMLGVEAQTLDGEGLVRAVLEMETDLLFNGGIGTYVRASTESDVEVGDPANDHVRVPANRLRAKVVAEGGNLGFTQRARIEYALRGGRINTDAIDNSGGVDLSDHEVNLKILFQPLLDCGELSRLQRDRLLERVKPEVIARVLGHNASQSLLLSLDQLRSRSRLVEFRDHLADLEQEGLLDRSLEHLPDREALRSRRSTFLGLTRPELAVISAYSKLSLQRKLVASPWIDDPYLERYLFGYFPEAIRERFPEAVRNHRLRREIVALELTNAVIDRMGAAFPHRMRRDTGVDPATAVAAWCVVVGSTEADRVFDALAESPAPIATVYESLLQWERAVESAAKLVVAVGPIGSIAERIDRWRGPVAAIAELQATAAAADSAAELRRLEEAGLPSGLARAMVGLGRLRTNLEIVRIAEEWAGEIADAALAYEGVGALVDLVGLERWLESIPGEDRWEKRAAEGLREDVAAVRRQMTLEVLRRPEATVAERVAAYAAAHEASLARVRALGEDLRSARRASLAGMIVAVRELRRLADRG